MQLTLTIDTASAKPDDYRRAASTLLHFGLGPDANASLTLDRVTISGDAQSVAVAATAAADAATATTPDPATIGFGGEAPPAPLPDPATVGFGSDVPSPGVGTAPPAAESVDAVLARVEKDEDGLPWDSRIHASTKTKNKDGRWKKRKNVTDAEVTRVEAELRQIMNIPAPAATTTATTAPPPPPPPAAATIPAPPAAAAAPPPPPPATTTAAPAAAGMTFAQLMAYVGPAMANGKLPGTKVEETMRNLGIVDGAGTGQLALLATRPDLVPDAYDALVAAASP